MKKILFICSFSCLFCLNNAFGDAEFNLWGSRRVSDAALTAWGNPYIDSGFIQDATREPLGFRIKQGWACCTNMSWQQVANIRGADRTENRIVSIKDDQAIIAMVARKIYVHGGRFCLTQLAVWSGSRNLEIVNQQPNWPGMPCVTLCEPGWDGPTCDTKVGEGTTGNDTPCDPTDIAASIEKVKQNVYEDNDAITFHMWRMGVANEQQFFAREKIDGVYEHAVYLGAGSFMKHGVVAQPMLVASVGSHPVTTWITTGPANSGKVKTLCAQGFTKNDKCELNSKNCDSNIWCTGYSDANFKSNIHNKVKNGYCSVIFCKDGTLALDSSFNCVTYDGVRTGRCEQNENELYGRLVKCKDGEIFDGETCGCTAAKSISKEIMQYGRTGKNAELVTDQCWTKLTAEDFQSCILGGAPAAVGDETKN